MENEIQLLKESLWEIKNLRRENELMRARLEMFDAINCMLHTQAASRSQGMMHPDIVRELEKFIEENKTPK